MSKPLEDLEALMRQMVLEHKRLLAALETQQGAMKKLDAKSMEEFAGQQEGIRLRIASLETRRKSLVSQMCIALKIQGPATIAKIAELFPKDRARILALRNELKAGMGAVATRATIAGKVAGAVLGHLNTVVRLLSGAVEQAGLYTKHGVPQVSPRIGMLEAVG